MNNDELKEALISGEPVEHKGIQYKCVSGIIYRVDARRRIFLQAELQDANTNSISYADPSLVKARKENIQ
jgi:hypothetical protein